jgi:peptidoglycan hydrolase CwlO-like protein
VQEKITEHEVYLEVMKHEAGEAEHAFQTKIDKFREEQTKLNTEIKSLDNFIASTRETRNKIKQEIDVSEKSIPMLNQLKPKIAQAEKRLEKLQKDDERIQGKFLFLLNF